VKDTTQTQQSEIETTNTTFTMHPNRTSCTFPSLAIIT
jgi:hypothetical protein